MNREEIRQAILELPGDEKIALIQEIGPALCEAIMNQPDGMRALMPMCREMMSKRPEMMDRMREMMSGEE